MRVCAIASCRMARSLAIKPPTMSNSATLKSAENPPIDIRASGERTIPEQANPKVLVFASTTSLHISCLAATTSFTARYAIGQTRHVHVSIRTTVLAIHRRTHYDDEP